MTEEEMMSMVIKLASRLHSVDVGEQIEATMEEKILLWMQKKFYQGKNL